MGEERVEMDGKITLGRVFKVDFGTLDANKIRSSHELTRQHMEGIRLCI